MTKDVSNAPDQNGEKTELKRVMGPGLLLLFVVGDVLGTGIYALTGEVAAKVGGIVWLPFLVAFVLATVTAAATLNLSPNTPRPPVPRFIRKRPLACISSPSLWPSL